MIKTLMRRLADLNAAMKNHFERPSPESSVRESVLDSVDVLRQIFHAGPEDPDIRIGQYAGMKCAAFMLENYYLMLFRLNLLGEVYQMHPDPTLLSNACLFHLHRGYRGQDHEALAVSEQALELGGFPSLDVITRAFSNFNPSDAPEARFSQAILTNTMKHPELFASGDYSSGRTGRYLSFLIAKVIDEGDAVWVLDFMEEHTAFLEENSPIGYTRTDVLGPDDFKAQLIVYMLHCTQSHKLLQAVAETDEPLFERLVSYREVQEIMLTNVNARRTFDLSMLPLDKVLTRRIVEAALKGISIHSQARPLRIVDLERLEASYLRAGMTSQQFSKSATKMAVRQFSIRECGALFDRLDESKDYLKTVMAEAETYKQKSLDFLPAGVYFDESLRQRLAAHLCVLSGVGISQDQDTYQDLGVERKSLSVQDLVFIAKYGRDFPGILKDKWIDEGLFNHPDTLMELAKLSQGTVNMLQNATDNVYSQKVLSSIPWQRTSIRDQMFSTDLGL